MTLPTLLERIEKADGAICGVKESLALTDELCPWPPYSEERLLFIQAIAGSLDASIALVERVLKVYSLQIGLDPSGNGAKLWWWPKGLGGEEEIRSESVAVDPALAVCAALLRALIHKEQHHGR